MIKITILKQFKREKDLRQLNVYKNKTGRNHQILESLNLSLKATSQTKAHPRTPHFFKKLKNFRKNFNDFKKIYYDYIKNKFCSLKSMFYVDILCVKDTVQSPCGCNKS